MARDDSAVLGILSEQRKRLVSTLLGHCEQSDWWAGLDAEEKSQLRQVVLDSIGRFYDLTRDMHKSLKDDGVRNRHALAMIESIHADVTALRRDP